jgi:adenylate cyclase
VLFGNIGLPERVSLSVIGPTVNGVARLEALTKEMGRQVLTTDVFAAIPRSCGTISIAISFAVWVRP